jgi:hypothetical protein
VVSFAGWLPWPLFALAAAPVITTAAVEAARTGPGARPRH